MAHLAGTSFVVRLDRASVEISATLIDDLCFLRESGLSPILVAPDRASARRLVRLINRSSNEAVCVSGADAATLPASAGGIGAVQTGLLMTLMNAGFLPVLEPIAYAPFGDEVELDADTVAATVASATEAMRALFFHDAGGVIDPVTSQRIGELTPAEALTFADDERIDGDVRSIIRAAALGVRGGVPAAQIVDGRIAHATIVELLTKRHLGTQVTGAVYTGG